MSPSFFSLLSGCLAIAIVAQTIAAEPEKPPVADAGLKPVFSVEKVTVRALQTQPERLSIEASGSVRTGGWTDGKLVLRKAQTRDGTLTFEFVAKPPEGMATQSITPIQASIVVDKPGLYRQVKVVAETNAKASE
jgi:hypothetical protein